MDEPWVFIPRCSPARTRSLPPGKQLPCRASASSILTQDPDNLLAGRGMSPWPRACGQLALPGIHKRCPYPIPAAPVTKMWGQALCPPRYDPSRPWACPKTPARGALHHPMANLKSAGKSTPAPTQGSREILPLLPSGLKAAGTEQFRLPDPAFDSEGALVSSNRILEERLSDLR